MGTLLTGDQFTAALWDFQRTAFRLEAQPVYYVPAEQDLLAQLRAGHSMAADEVPELREWFDRVAERTRQGARIERVRIYDDPPTDYQRWERWCDPWNIQAGEVIRYLPRQQACDIGLLPAAGPEDWWLFDDRYLIVMSFDACGHMTRIERTDDDATVVQAIAWRDLAVLHSTPAEARSTSTTHE